MNNENVIVTHSGPFHADDVFAAAWVMFTQRKQWRVVRTRDQKVIEDLAASGATVLDVGGVYDPASRRFDHHFSPQPVGEDGNKLATAGMVVKAFPWEDGLLMDEVKSIASAIDLTDTGTKVPGWSLSMTVHKANPTSEKPSEEEFSERFLEVVYHIVDCLKISHNKENSGNSTYYAYPLVGEIQKGLATWAWQHDLAMAASACRIWSAIPYEEENRKYMVLDRYEPAMNETLPQAPESVLYCIFPAPGGEWMVQQIPVSPGSFQGRKPLPEAWAGKRGADLDAVTGIEGCVFCHPGRFIGGHKTLEGAKALADLAASA